MVGKHRVEGVDFGSPNCPESIFTPGKFFGSFDALGRVRGRTATQRSEKGSEKVLGRVLGKGFSEGF